MWASRVTHKTPKFSKGALRPTRGATSGAVRSWRYTLSRPAQRLFRQVLQTGTRVRTLKNGGLGHQAWLHSGDPFVAVHSE
eukprot:2305975-Prymnesium_polylepis.1